MSTSEDQAARAGMRSAMIAIAIVIGGDAVRHRCVSAGVTRRGTPTDAASAAPIEDRPAPRNAGIGPTRSPGGTPRRPRRHCGPAAAVRRFEDRNRPRPHAGRRRRPAGAIAAARGCGVAARDRRSGDAPERPRGRSAVRRLAGGAGRDAAATVPSARTAGARLPREDACSSRPERIPTPACRKRGDSTAPRSLRSRDG